MKRFTKSMMACGIGAVLGLSPAFAELQRVGPVDAAHGFPAWYQDRSGMAMELCSIDSQATLDQGLCLLLPGNTTLNASGAEQFPQHWGLEHFYWGAATNVVSAGADPKTGAVTPGAGSTQVVMALQSTFSGTAVQSPDQITFGRWRVRVNNVPCNGSYTFYTPNKPPQTFQGVAGTRISQTDDFGIGAPGDFVGALRSSVGPFLAPATQPGGAMLTPITGPNGKRYLSNNADLVPVTGSPVANPLKGSTKPYIPASITAQNFNNYFLVEGPGIQSGNCGVTEAVYAETFTVMGRLYDGPMPSRAVIDRVTYRVVDTNADGTPDSFRIGAWANALQEVGRPAPELAMSLFHTDPANPANFTAELGMTRFAVPNSANTATPSFNFFQGQSAPVRFAGVPAVTQATPVYTHARIRTVTDQPASQQDVKLVDELMITGATYNANTKELKVTAESGAFLQQHSAVGTCSVPCLTLDNFNLPAKTVAGAAIDFQLKTDGASKLAIATVTVPNVQTPPNAVTVLSSLGGRDTQLVRYSGASVVTPLLLDDTVSTAMNVPVAIDALANDVGVAAVPNLRVCYSAAQISGTASCPLATTAALVNGTALTAQGGAVRVAGNQITYTPPSGRGGITDVFYYQVTTLQNMISPRGRITVNVGNVSGLPDAIDDLNLTTTAGRTLTVNVLANDFAPAGVNVASLTLIGDPVNTTTLAAAPGTAAFLNGQLQFTPQSAGSYTMSYTFTDNVGVVANRGVVAVNVVAAETLTGTGRFRTRSNVLTATGISTVRAGQVIELRNASTTANACANPSALPLLGRSLPVTAVGVWDVAQITLPAGAVAPTSLVAYSPAYGGCTQFAVRVTQ